MNHICTWFCADEIGHESIFPQTGKKSSGKAHQDIYWRCVVLFYLTSKRFNSLEQHIFFTNVKVLPRLDGFDVAVLLKELGVEVVFTDLKYKTPAGYFQMFQNQFYEFSILEYLDRRPGSPDDKFLIVDSDCIFIKPAEALFNEAADQGFLSFEDDCTTELVIHGLSRINMKSLYEELLSKKIIEIPGYHLGEFFLASKANLKIIFSSFVMLWPVLLERFEQGQSKFNEEAQTLSFIYFKNGFKASKRRDLMKRIWTNPVFYRDAAPSDINLVLWHLPAEKTYGLKDLYHVLIKRYLIKDQISNEQYMALVTQKLGVPYLPATKKLKYYIVSYFRALNKRLHKATALR